MNFGFHLFIAYLLIFSNSCQNLLVIQGHAHNYYENENPLRDALENGFVSVEVDVHLVDGELYVSMITRSKWIPPERWKIFI